MSVRQKFLCAYHNTDDYNLALGYLAGELVTTASNVICIGTEGGNADNSCYIGNIYARTVDPGRVQCVVIDDNGKSGNHLSSRCFEHAR